MDRVMKDRAKPVLQDETEDGNDVRSWHNRQENE